MLLLLLHSFQLVEIDPQSLTLVSILSFLLFLKYITELKCTYSPVVLMSIVVARCFILFNVYVEGMNDAEQNEREHPTTRV